jgi:hypothetical protein
MPWPASVLAATAYSDSPAMWIVAFLIVGGAILGSAIVRNRGARRRSSEHAAMAHQQQSQQRAKNERDERVYGQHVTLNDLTARKIELETRLMQAQAENIDQDRRMREQNEEYHRLMVQKAQLEIQSLKLHIREQQKRNEDFTSYDDE